MLSGDKQSVVNEVAKAVGIDEAYGDFQIDYLQSAEFFKSNDKLIFNQGLNEFSSAMYLMDTSLNVIKKVIPNANQNRRQRNASKLIVRNNKIYMKTNLQKEESFLGWPAI